jgi:hypothetical protein
MWGGKAQRIPPLGILIMTANEKLESTFRINKILGYAVAAAMLVYAAVVEVFRFKEISFNVMDPAVLEKLRFVFVFLSFAAYFIINFLNKKILVKQPGQTREKLLQKLTLANLVSLTLAELPALFGLILFLGSGNPRDFYPLLIISALNFYVFFPKFSFWSNWSRVVDNTAL